MTTIRLLRAPEARWAQLNPILEYGQPGFDRTNFIVKIGDGTTPWLDLPAVNQAVISPEDIENAVELYLDANPVSVGTEYVQSTPQASWIISHNLGRKPSVTVYVGGEEVLADVTASNTQVTVTFSAPYAGTATLI